MEYEIIEEYRWPPQVVANIPYKWFQIHFRIKEQKSISIKDKREKEAFKRKMVKSKPIGAK